MLHFAIINYFFPTDNYLNAFAIHLRGLIKACFHDKDFFLEQLKSGLKLYYMFDSNY